MSQADIITYLIDHGESTFDDFLMNLKMNKPTLYKMIGRLRRSRLLKIRYGKGSIAYYDIHPEHKKEIERIEKMMEGDEFESSEK